MVPMLASPGTSVFLTILRYKKDTKPIKLTEAMVNPKIVIKRSSRTEKEVMAFRAKRNIFKRGNDIFIRAQYTRRWFNKDDRLGHLVSDAGGPFVIGC